MLHSNVSLPILKKNHGYPEKIAFNAKLYEVAMLKVLYIMMVIVTGYCENANTKTRNSADSMTIDVAFQSFKYCGGLFYPVFCCGLKRYFVPSLSRHLLQSQLCCSSEIISFSRT